MQGVLKTLTEQWWKLFGNLFFIKLYSVEAGMIALNRNGTFLIHEDYVEGIAVVQAKKKSSLNYYAWIKKNSNLNIDQINYNKLFRAI